MACEEREGGTEKGRGTEEECRKRRYIDVLGKTREGSINEGVPIAKRKPRGNGNLANGRQPHQDRGRESSEERFVHTSVIAESDLEEVNILVELRERQTELFPSVRRDFVLALGFENPENVSRQPHRSPLSDFTSLTGQVAESENGRVGGEDGNELRE